jgi:enamine deaminase RidA (YjgF/YER057c/UK114 family)
MTDAAAILKNMGFELPDVAPPLFNYVPYVISGSLVFIAGQVPFLNGQKMYLGRLGENMDVAAGQKAAQVCALNLLANLRDAVAGDWSRVVRCVKLGGFVNSTPDFTDQSLVINAASDLMVLALGERGKHARFAVSAPSLPAGASVEIDAVFEITPA